MGSIHTWSVHSAVYRATSEGSSSSDGDEEEIDSGSEIDSSSTSDLSTSEDEDIREDGIPVSATHGDGVDVLWDRIQEKVLEATNNKHIVFTVPSDGLQLR